MNPRFHRRGAGKKLVSFLEHKARRRRVKTLKLSSSIVAQEFYKKLGYKRVRIIRRKIGGDGILMKKDL
ncbi:MAG: GNAT family N-acetyltransferase [Candidatus Micrarchaeota archaeon]